MAEHSPFVASLLEPVSADEPCGPDFELAGDADYVQIVGRIEGSLPSSFFTRDDEGNLQAFDRKSLEIGPDLKQIAKLLQSTRDLRLLTLASRLCALNRDLPGLCDQVAGAGALLQERWAEVHPQPEDGDYGLRMAVLQTLDDMPTVVLPLQHITLADSRRSGPINYRVIMIASGEVAPPEGETPIDRAGIDRAFAEADLDGLRATYGTLVALRDALGQIRVTAIEKDSFDSAVSLDRVTELATKMTGVLEGVLAGRDPTASLAPASPAGGEADRDGASSAAAAATTPTGPVRNSAEAAAALAAASRYLQAFEPSGPAELLVRQARALVGKSFLDVMRMLVPNQADEATIAIGADRAFELTFGQLAAVADESFDDPAPEEPAADEESWSDAPSDDEAAADDASADAPAADDDTEIAAPNGAAATVSGAPPPVAGSRREAIGLLRQVASFYRVSEPASPIPLLLDRACALAESDFLTILKDVLPQLARREPEA